MFPKGKIRLWPEAQSVPMRTRLRHFFTSQPEMAKIVRFSGPLLGFLCCKNYGEGHTKLIFQKSADLVEYHKVNSIQRPVTASNGLRGPSKYSKQSSKYLPFRLLFSLETLKSHLSCDWIRTCLNKRANITLPITCQKALVDLQ